MLLTWLKRITLLLALVAIGAIEFIAGYTYGWNEAPAPTSIEVPMPVEVGRAWDKTMVLGVSCTGLLVPDPESDEGMLYMVYVDMMHTDGMSQDTVFLDFRDGTPRTITIHVDASGATPLVSVDLAGVGEVIAETDCLAGSDSYGRYLGLYCEGSGSGTTPLANNTVDSVSWDEVA